MKQNNIFNNKLGKQALSSLSSWGKTNIRYELVERFGIEKIQKDLRDAMGSDNYYAWVCEDTHEPMNLIKRIVYNDKFYKVQIPIMPIVIISATPRQ